MLKIEYLIGYYSDAGAVKAINQDSLCIKIAKYYDASIVLTVLCDGLGGMQKGELASGTVVKAFSTWFEEEIPLFLEETIEGIKLRLELKVKELNNLLFDYGKRKGFHIGTTISGLLIWHTKEAIIFNVGDTRVYAVTDELEQLTEDHTIVALKIKKGIISQKDGINDYQKNVLTQCIGGASSVSPQVIKPERKYDKYLLCTDGFRNRISNEEIYNVLVNSSMKSEHNIDEVLSKIAKIDMLRGENDNISAIYISKV